MGTLTGLKVSQLVGWRCANPTTSLVACTLVSGLALLCKSSTDESRYKKIEHGVFRDATCPGHGIEVDVAAFVQRASCALEMGSMSKKKTAV